MIAVGAVLGAWSRYGIVCLTSSFMEPKFPISIIIVNGIGGIAMGSVAGWMVVNGPLDPPIRAFIVVGFLGAFTTFSAFSMDAVELMMQGNFGGAVGYIAASLGVGIGGVLSGMWAMRIFLG